MTRAGVVHETPASVDLDGVARRLDDAPTSSVFVWDARASAAPRLTFMIGLGVADRAGPSAAEVRAMLARWQGPARAVGGVPFDEEDARAGAVSPQAGFIVPRVLLVDGPDGVRALVAASDGEGAGEADPLLAWAERGAPARHVPTSLAVSDDGVSAFCDVTQRALDAIGRGELEKVVVRRTVTLGGEASPSAVLERLRGLAGTTRFAVSQDGAWFLGATPELLVDKRGVDVVTEAVAGSAPRDADCSAESRVLLESAKDRWEHELVGREIERTLRRVGVRVDHRAAPSVRSLAHVHHLVTPIEGKATRPMDVLDVVAALHPTPAMGGVPRERALAFIRAWESPRGLYASPIGWADAAGEGTFVVGIRSVALSRGAVTLFAGVGLVRGSEIVAELAETDAKLEAARRALGFAASAGEEAPGPARPEHAEEARAS